MGILRLIYPGRQGFRSIRSDPTDHAGSSDWRREVIGGNARAADEVSCSECDRRRAEGYRALVTRGAAEGDDRGTSEFSLTWKGRIPMFTQLIVATFSLSAASAVIGQS